MFLVLDVEMVKHLPLLRFSDVGVVVFCIKFAFPDLDIAVLLLDQLYQVLILLNEVSILSKEQLYLLLKIIYLTRLP